MSTKSVKREITRSRTGCWTCRTRRKKCDETRPVCRTCVGLDLACEGYGVRLKWAVHRKSRVTFNNASSRGGAVRAIQSPRSSNRPSPESNNTLSPESPDSNSPEERKARDELLLHHLGEPTFSTLSKLEREALYDFADWGAATLGATMAIGPEYFAENLAGCSESRSMLLNCLTYQITLDPKYAQYADQYYCRSLEEFRHALSVANSLDNDCTACAGLLLCSISMNRAMPWTVHLNGIAAMLREKGVFDSMQEDRHDTMALIGTLDLATHILGRQNEQLHVWYNHCRHKPGIEEITGLPRSLIDILSSIMHPGVEERLLQWTQDEKSDATISKIWDTVRYAGIIAARDFTPAHEPMSLLCESAAHYVLLRLRELDAAIKDRLLAGRRALLFALTMAGAMPALLTAHDKSYITASIFELSDGDGDLYHQEVTRTLTEYWAHWASGGRGSLQQFTKARGRELGLF